MEHSFEQLTWIPFTQEYFVPSLVEIVFWRRRFLNFVNAFSLFRYYLPLEKGGVLCLNKLESPSPKDALCQVWLKWPGGSECENIFLLKIWESAQRYIQRKWNYLLYFCAVNIISMCFFPVKYCWKDRYKWKSARRWVWLNGLVIGKGK